MSEPVVDPADVPDDLVFTTPAAEPAEPDPDATVRFVLDGEELTAVRPKDAAFIFLSGAASRSATDADRVSALAQFLDLAMTPPSAARLRDRLMDRNDSLGIEQLASIMSKLVDRWTKPTNRAARRAAR